MGLARRLRERTGAWVAMHEADTHTDDRYASHDDFRRASDEELRKRGGLAADFEAVASQPSGPDNFAEFTLQPDRFLVDGERPLGPGSALGSLWTPGHTPG